MTMKPTISKDKVLRYSVRILHRIGRDWLISYVAYELVTYGQPPVGSKCTVWRNIRQWLDGSGIFAAEEWADGLSPETRKEIESQATAFVADMFPELCSKND